MKFPTYKEMGERIAEQALDEYVINGKTLREWIKLLSEQEPCDDVVSRQAVLDIVNNPLNIRLDEIIKKLPSVRPQEQTGHWINHISSIECSCCGNKLFADDENENCEDYDAIDDLGYKYCPDCGAKMVEPQESEDKE